ncbi:MAG: hypothetical protein A3G23_04020 [Bacteroidetes bacterium RIFCSPLOWO2_12_FULL_37_12]|nr:MAG: hypothetical protein A3G23_04020 [Bacteroidetes bacterium RIFCSPLOWO2_12_FULL_37_12]
MDCKNKVFVRRISDSLLILLLVAFSHVTTFSQGLMQVSITADQNNICRGDTVTLTVSVNGGTGPYTYTWLNPTASDSVVKVTPSYSTVYGLQVTDALGADTTRNILVTVRQKPKPDFSLDTVCVGSSISITDKSSMPSQSCSADLIMSEYVEGSNFSKGIEIYNGTNRTINLTGYTIQCYYRNSGTIRPAYNLKSFDLIPGNAYVLCNPRDTSVVDPLLKAKADDDSTSIDAFDFNGDDALVLRNPEGIIVDFFGKVNDPSASSGKWDDGVANSKDHTLIRNSNINYGAVNDPDSFLPGQQWDEKSKDFFDNLGIHTMNCPTPAIASYKWKYGDGDSSDTNGSHQYVYGTTGEFSLNLTLTSDNGCSADTTVETEILSKSTISIDTGFGYTKFCEGGRILLSSPAPNGNQWYRDGLPVDNETFKTYEAKSGGTYQLKVNYGCTDTITAPLQITVFENPIPKITGDSILCEVDSAVLSIDLGGLKSYRWLLNSDTTLVTDSSFTYYGSTGTDGDVFDVIVTDTNNCIGNYSDFNIRVFEIPNVSISGTISDTLCPGKKVSLDGTTPNVSLYIWMVDGDTVKSNPLPDFDFTAPTFRDTQEVKLIGITPDGCSNFAIVNFLTIDSVKAGNSETFCSNEKPLVLTGGIPSDGIWSSKEIDVDEKGMITETPLLSGNYLVTYSFAECTSEKIISIKSSTAPTDKKVCLNEGPFLLGNGIPGGGIWAGPGLINASLGNVDTAGLSGSADYIYTVDGCKDTITIFFTNRAVAPTIKCDSSSFSTVYFSWNAIPDVSNYFISEMGFPFINKGNITSYSVSNLFENQTVTLQVYSQNNDCGADTSTLASCVTKACVPYSIKMTRSDSNLCVGEKTSIKTEVTGGKGPFTFTYLNSINTSDPAIVFAPLDTLNSYPTGYWVKVTVRDQSQKTCQSVPSKLVDSLQIFVYPKPKVTIYADTIGVNETGLVRFYDPDSTGIIMYNWNFGDGITGDKSNLLHFYPDSGSYSINLQVKNSYGCSSNTSKIYLVNSAGVKIDSVLNLVIVKIDTVKTVIFPTIFSPNNDLRNDLFRPLPLGKMTEMKMEIFNRWGQKIFETNDPVGGWNGNYPNGKPCDLGTYIYSVTGKDAKGNALHKAIRGSVVLIR